MGGDDDSKNILTLQLQVTQTISRINKCTPFRQIFKDYSSKHP